VTSGEERRCFGACSFLGGIDSVELVLSKNIDEVISGVARLFVACSTATLRRNFFAAAFVRAPFTYICVT